MSQLLAPAREMPSEPDALASAVLRRHGLVPARSSPAVGAPQPPGHAGLAAADFGSKVQRSVSRISVPPLRLGAIATEAAFPTAAVLQRAAAAVNARYNIQREPTPTEGAESGALPLAYPSYGGVSEGVAEEVEAAPAPQPSLTFAEMLARVRGEVQTKPEAAPAPQEAAAPRRAPNATFAEMLALIGRKQGAPSQGAAAGPPGARAAAGPPPAQRSAATSRRRAQVEEVTPSAASSPAAAISAAETPAAQPQAEKPTGEEGDEEPWSPPPHAPPAEERPLAAIQMAPAAHPTHPARGRWSIEEVLPAIEAGTSSESIDAQRKIKVEPQDATSGQVQLIGESPAAEPSSVQRELAGLAREPFPAADVSMSAEQLAPSVQRETAGAAIGPVLEQPHAPAQSMAESRPKPQFAEETGPIAPPPAAEATAAATEPKPATGPVLLQRQSAQPEAPSSSPEAEEAALATARHQSLPLVERPAPVEPRPAVEQAAYDEPSAEAGEAGPAPALVPASAGQRWAEAEPNAPVETPSPESSRAGQTAPGMAQRQAASTTPHETAGAPRSEAPIAQRTAELPLVQRSTLPSAVLRAEPVAETESPPAMPGMLAPEQAVPAMTSAQTQLPISTAPPERPQPIPIPPAAPAFISRKEASPSGAMPAEPLAEERPAAAGEVWAGAPTALPGQAQTDLQRLTEEGTGEIAPEAPSLGNAAPEAAWAPVLPQARAVLQRAQSQPPAEASDLPLVPPPAVVVVNRHPPGNAQREAEAETAEPEPPRSAPAPAAEAPAPVIIQRAVSTSEGGPEAEMQGAAAEPSAEGAPASAEPEPPPSVDLDRLARNLMPLIKRILAVERERRPRRW